MAGVEWRIGVILARLKMEMSPFRQWLLPQEADLHLLEPHGSDLMVKQVEEGGKGRVDRWSQRCCHVQTVVECQLAQTTASDWQGLASLPKDKKDEVLPPGE